MKKNRMMRTASGLLVLTLLTTSVISGTIAKYTTQDSGSDNARVAKWGVTLQVDGSLYGPGYLTTKNTATEATTGVSVLHSSTAAGADQDFVVAPGTKSDKGFHFAVTGTPEVSSKVKAEIKTQNIYLTKGEYGVMVPTEVVTAENFSNAAEGYYTESDGTYTKATDFVENTTYYTLEDYVNLEDDYYPVVYKLGSTAADNNHKTEFTTGAVTADSLADAANAIAGAIEADGSVTTANDGVTTYTLESKVIDPNTDLAEALKLASETLTWEWAYDNDDCKEEGDAAGDLCKADTILGNLMAERQSDFDGKVVKLDGNAYAAPTEITNYCLDTQFSIDITVTQVD